MKILKQKMKEKIKVYSNDQYLDGYIKNEFLSENGEANIYINIKNKNELIDSRTMNNQIDLVKDIYDFIEDKSSMLSNDTIIHFHIMELKLTKEEKDKVKHLIKEHYAIELYKAQKEYDRLKMKIIKLLLLGFIFLMSYALLYLYTNFNFFLEVFGFLFSFSLWEAFDCYIYAFNEIKTNREAITQNLLMDVFFDD